MINICHKFGYTLQMAYGTRTVYPNIKTSGFPRNESTLADCLIFAKHVAVGADFWEGFAFLTVHVQRTISSRTTGYW